MYEQAGNARACASIWALEKTLQRPPLPEKAGLLLTLT